MEIDMLTAENATESLIKLTNIKRKDFEKYKNEYKDDYWEINKFLDYFNYVDLDSIDLENIKIKGEHCTTNSDRCEDIKRHGIKGIYYLLRNDSEIKSFLEENDIKIDIEKEVLLSKNEAIKLNSLNRVEFRILNDNDVNIFLMRDAYQSYCSVIEESPEIFRTIDLELETELVKKWSKRKNVKKYILTVLADIVNFSLRDTIVADEEVMSMCEEKKYIYEILGNKEVEDGVKKWIIVRLMLVILSGERPDDSPFGFIDGEKGIYPEDIIEIKEMNVGYTI